MSIKQQFNSIFLGFLSVKSNDKKLYKLTGNRQKNQGCDIQIPERIPHVKKMKSYKQSNALAKKIMESRNLEENHF